MRALVVGLFGIAAAIDTIHLDAGSARITASAAIGATAVYGARCDWTAPAGLTIVSSPAPTGGVGGDPAMTYVAGGPAGTYAATCAIPGGPAQTVNVSL